MWGRSLASFSPLLKLVFCPRGHVFRVREVCVKVARFRGNLALVGHWVMLVEEGVEVAQLAEGCDWREACFWLRICLRFWTIKTVYVHSFVQRAMTS